MTLRAPRCWLVPLLAGLASAGVPAAHAQESFFSLQFLGASEETGDARARGMGSHGIALDDPQTAIALNPGSLASLRRMTLSVMGGLGTRTASNAFSEDARSEAYFPHLRVALPVPGKFVVSTGFMTQRSFRSSFVLPPRQAGSQVYLQTFERSGSLYTVPVGVARPIGERIHLGLTVDFQLGTVDESWTTAGDSLLSLRTRQRDGFGGTTVTLGAVVTPVPWGRVGLAYTPSFTADIDARTTLEDARVGSGVTPLRDELAAFEAEMPATWRAGVAANLGRHWLATADYLYRDWTVYDGRLYDATTLRAEQRLGGGVEYRPLRGVWWGRASYRAGVSTLTWPQEVGGEPLRETTFHAGIGYDLREGYGRLDAALEYTRAGSVESNGYEESRWNFILSLSGQEIWRRHGSRRP